MLRRVNRDHAFAAVCAENGAITEVLSDTKKFFANAQSLPDITKMLQDEARAAYLKFIGEALSRGHSMQKEIVLIKDGREFAFFLFGIARNAKVFMLAVQSPQQIFLIYDEFMAMINEQARELREVQKKSAQCAGAQRAKGADTKLLEDYMRLNNELANMQRELSIANLSLQNQEKRFRELVTFNPDAQIVLGSSGRILFFNPAAEKILGLSHPESTGSVFPLDLTMEKEFCLRSGQRRTCVEIRQTAVSWENGPATLVSLRDITERKQIEQMRDDVDRILRHDLISPLNPIVSLPQLLMENPALTEDQKLILAMISKAGKRMLDMVRLSLNLYKMEQGSFTFVPQPVDLLSTFRDILADVSERLRARKVFVRMVLQDALARPQDTFWVTAEPTLCYSLFSNLILNAIEASPTSGVVSIFLDQNGQAQIRIHNSGAVPPDVRPRFFEKYVTSGKAQGTGLGTYSARLLVLTMGGEIGMETAEDSGTTLTVRLAPSKGAGLAQESPRLEQKPEPVPVPLQGEMRPPAGYALRTGCAQLAQDLELSSFEALARARDIHARLREGSTEHEAFSRIIEAVMRFDFETAKAHLRNISSGPEL
jgi:signal transduction histidine kinase